VKDRTPLLCLREKQQAARDDIPSVTLALLLQAFYLSEDKSACEAVYGVRFSSEEVRRWLEVLRAGGDAGVIGSLFQATALLTGLFG